MTPASVVKVCDRLQARGYVEQVRDMGDRRVLWFQLTKTGPELFEGLVALNRGGCGPVRRRLQASDPDTLARILNELAETIEARPAQPPADSAS